MVDLDETVNAWIRDSKRSIYVVGEEHPEGLFQSAINNVDKLLPTEQDLHYFDILDFIPSLRKYQEVMDKYFLRVEDNGKRYLDGSKEILFDQKTEKEFWSELLNAIEGVYPLRPQQVEDEIKKLKRSRDIFSCKKSLVKEHKPNIIYHEGTSPKNERNLVFGIHGIVHIAATNTGTQIVYLDDGFAPFSDPSLNHWQSQEGREEYWVSQIMNNSSNGVSLAFVGADHLLGRRPGIPHIGGFLDLLTEYNLSYRKLELLK